MLTNNNPAEVQAQSARTVNDVVETLNRHGAEAAAQGLVADVGGEGQAIASSMPTGGAGADTYKAYLAATTAALEKSNVLPALSLAFARELESSPRFNGTITPGAIDQLEQSYKDSSSYVNPLTMSLLDGLKNEIKTIDKQNGFPEDTALTIPSIDQELARLTSVRASSEGATAGDQATETNPKGAETDQGAPAGDQQKQEQALQALEQLPQSATLNQGSVLYDMARSALEARSSITHEPVNSDAVLRECNRIMVLNGYPDAHLDGKSNISMADLPASWNAVSYGQNFKLYDQAELQKLSQTAATSDAVAQGKEPSPSDNASQTQPTQPGSDQPQPPAASNQPAPDQPYQPYQPGQPYQPDQPGNTPPSDGSQPPTTALDKGDPNSFFICQFENARFNPNGPASSEDCGPTSLAMIAKYYGVSFKDTSNGKSIDAGSADPEALVRAVRGLMTGSDSTKDGTTVPQVENAARAMGFKTAAVDNVSDLNTALDNGEMVVLSGNPVDYEKDLGLHYGIGGTVYNGGHFITVVGRQGDNYIVNDPANGKGSMVLTGEQIAKYIANEHVSGEVGVAVYE